MFAKGEAALSFTAEESGCAPMSRSELLRACHYWTGIEYFNLTEAPEEDEKKRVWRIELNADLPWIDPDRRKRLWAPKGYETKLLAFLGVMDIRQVTADLRTLLGASPVDPRKMRSAGDTPMMVLQLNADGFVTGDVFISSLPWAMGRVARGGSMADFSGFGGVCDGLKSQVRALLVKRLLISEQDDDKAKPDGPDPANQEGSERLRPLTVEDVPHVLALVQDALGWCPTHAPTLLQIQARLVKMSESDSMDDTTLFNSFVAEDIRIVCGELAQGHCGPALAGYLRGRRAPDRFDLRDGDPQGGRGELLAAVQPTRMPAGCWPDKKLVMAQQFAVNKIANTLLPESGIYSVNGPPGTGKTTLLRDVVAAVVVERARRMTAFERPLNAMGSSIKLEGEYRYGTPRAIDASLCGLGIVVASSNNGAVENVTKELPMASDALNQFGLDYFSIVADSVACGKREKVRPAKRRNWGLIAAVLGSASRRRSFAERFWWEDTPKPDTEPDPLRLRSLPGVMKEGLHGAKPWAEARRNFNAALRAAQERAAHVEQAAGKAIRRAALDEAHAEVRRGIDTAKAQCAALKQAAHEQRERVDSLSAQHLQAQARRMAAEQRLAAAAARDSARLALDAFQEHFDPDQEPTLAAEAVMLQEQAIAAARESGTINAQKPSFLDCLFDRGANRRWREGAAQAATRARTLADAAATARKHHAHAEIRCRQLLRLASGLQAAELSWAEAQANARAHGVQDESIELLGQNMAQLASELALGRIRLEAANHAAAAQASALEKLIAKSESDAPERASIGNWFAKNSTSDDFIRQASMAGLDDAELQLLSPFEDEELLLLRREVFRHAIEVHKAFVADAWSALRPTLGLFMEVLKGARSPHLVSSGVQALWEAFFLVVPVVSSTFASFSRLFAGMGRESLGWLLIDEAGQAPPQAALGAIWRSKRVVVVGDPRQLEPVAKHPVEMLEPWRSHCAAQSLWTPGECSAQSLADIGNQYGTYLAATGDCEPTWVGSPLRVHRRCLNPMFDVANEIAYGGVMVHAVQEKRDACAWLGASCWIDVESSDAEGHWIPKQGDRVMKMLEDMRAMTGGAIRNADGALYFNVISPFKAVDSRMRDLLYRAYPANRFEKAADMAGTVHTFQGKEAAVVVLVLGGDPNKAGAISEFAGNVSKPNLLNVAVTRAKERIYVVGDLALWRRHSALYDKLATHLRAGGSGFAASL
ncbi:hypothetical protein D5041_15805 [Verminephrobacter aporrectodeae subsp. tuberculatae]|uniref:DEAD/DEAH box helicase n=1 Tax=Verminephrobacter aporrectodeae TaxID=1110389 RepID=UPI002238B81B|nr:AAA domain-containing protein [Verminephrobacter aporrectodeae]MCW5221159.1 hypothetical protein [Verminephrobacter aporrectodeae subsp. tuberculatae]MCW5290450.1 hypothetical protein [Verminephrobacter aporrectodeae subsp. tuberculatae]